MWTKDKKQSVGLPGVQEDETVSPELGALLLTDAGGKPRIGEEDIAKAADILTRYKNGKKNLEDRIVENELWWELRHWEAIGRKDGTKANQIAKTSPKSTSAWLFNTLANKHADAMDNYPEPVVLPREKSDVDSAKTLSSVLPVVLEQNDFEQTYSDNWWEKLKHGTAPYGAFWNPRKENGLGDIDIREIDLLKIFWEPGITDIQKSRNFFIVELVDEDLLEQQYPEHKGKLGGGVIDVKQYIYDDEVDTSGKSVVVDWYYKTVGAAGKTLLHYCKFVGTTLLYASENDPNYRDTGWYEHGQYPVVFDVLFPEKGTPVGFGLVDICRDPQLYIDKMSSNIMENAMMATKKRWFVSENTAVNETEFADWTNDFVHVAGELDERRLQEIVTQPLSSIYLEVVNMKIEEMKDTAGNRDVNSGGAGSGVTAAAAIAALQEAGNKTSRDMISGSYRTHVKINSMCIELMRQFYDETRSFRITGETGDYQFVDMSNADIKDQITGTDNGGVPTYRRPIFDLKIKAQKKNPFSRMEQNERAKELYGLGFFNPERAQEALGALAMMDFEGVDKVRDHVQRGQTLLSVVQQMSAQMEQMAAMLQMLTGQNVGGEAGAPVPAQGGQASGATPKAGSSISGAVMQAQTPMTDYGAQLAKRSAPDMSAGSNAAMPV